MEIIIINGNITTKLDLDENNGNIMKQAITDCINYPVKNPLIKYEDKKDLIFFSAEYLKNSIIKFPK